MKLQAAGRTIVQGRPVAYQNVDGRRTAIPVAYALHGREITFAVGAYEVVTGSRQLIVHTLLLHWNGSRWRPMAVPKIPGDPEFVVLNTVSCSGPNQCLAIGFSSG